MTAKQSTSHFGGSAQGDSPVDREELRTEVQRKYAAVAVAPHDDYHFHTGRVVAERCRYDMVAVDALPAVAVESFAGVANPFEHRSLSPGEHVVDLGAGAGFDCFLAGEAVGPGGRVIGVDMTDEMLEKAGSIAVDIDASNVEFRKGYLEELPVEDQWADVVISNGVINLCPDKVAALHEAWRVLRPGGVMQFADIANGNEVPEEARRHIDLWTGWIAGGLPCAGWKDLLESVGFVDVEIGAPVDTFGGAGGEENARSFDVSGYSFIAYKPKAAE